MLPIRNINTLFAVTAGALWVPLLPMHSIFQQSYYYRTVLPLDQQPISILQGYSVFGVLTILACSEGISLLHFSVPYRIMQLGITT